MSEKYVYHAWSRGSRGAKVRVEEFSTLCEVRFAVTLSKPIILNAGYAVNCRWLALGQKAGYQGEEAVGLEVEVIVAKYTFAGVATPAMSLFGAEVEYRAQGGGHLRGLAAVEDDAGGSFLGISTGNVGYTANEWGDPGQAARHGFQNGHALGFVI